MLDFSRLSDKVASAVSDSGLGFLERPSFPTGLTVFDALNASYDRNGALNLGPRQGVITTFVGGSGGGKSTALHQSIINGINADPNFQAIFFEPERALNISRILSLSGWPKDYFQQHIFGKRLILINDNTHTEDLGELIDRIYELKLSEYCNMKFDSDGKITGKVDFEKTRALQNQLPPTLVAVDSLANLYPRMFSGETDVDDNTRGMRAAKANSELIKSSMSKIFKANIPLHIINHVRKKVSTNKYAGDERPIKWLNMGENLPGGNVAIYNADHIIRIEQVKKFKDPNMYGENTHGYYAEVKALKSRSNASGVPFSCVFLASTGFSEILTNFELLVSAKGILKGSPQGGFYFQEYPNVKFRRKDVLAVASADQNLFALLKNYTLQYLVQYISSASLGALTKDDVAEGIDYMEKHPHEIIPRLQGPSLTAFIQRYGLEDSIDTSMDDESIKNFLMSGDYNWWGNAWQQLRNQITEGYAG